MLADTSKLLVIDDEAGLRRSLNFGLAQRGYAIDEVEEGLPALKLIESSFIEGRPYRAVIADINLPDINGLKLLELIKSSYPSLPVIVISAYGNEATQDAVKTKHGDAYLPKPFMVDELTELMDRIPRRELEPVELPASDVQKVSVSAYAMVRFREGADWMAIFQRLYFMEHVIYCDAVHDVYDVVLLLNGQNRAEIDRFIDTKIRSIPDVSEVLLSPIVTPKLDPEIQDFIDNYNQQRSINPAAYKIAHASTALSTYLLVSIEPGRFSEVFPKLYFMRGVVSCDATRGEYDAVVLIQSHSFEENKRILNEEVKLIDGIARTRSMKIINIFEM